MYIDALSDVSRDIRFEIPVDISRLPAEQAQKYYDELFKKRQKFRRDDRKTEEQVKEISDQLLKLSLYFSDKLKPNNELLSLRLDFILQRLSEVFQQADYSDYLRRSPESITRDDISLLLELRSSVRELYKTITSFSKKSLFHTENRQKFAKVKQALLMLDLFADQVGVKDYYSILFSTEMKIHAFQKMNFQKIEHFSEDDLHNYKNRLESLQEEIRQKKMYIKNSREEAIKNLFQKFDQYHTRVAQWLNLIDSVLVSRQQEREKKRSEIQSIFDDIEKLLTTYQVVKSPTEPSIEEERQMDKDLDRIGALNSAIGKFVRDESSEVQLSSEQEEKYSQSKQLYSKLLKIVVEFESLN